MLLAINAVLYLAALSLSLCVLTPVPEGASRRVRAARFSLALGGGAAIAAAITLTFVGLWVESALVGCFALVVVVVCLWVALSHSSWEHDDGEDDDDGGGGRPSRSVVPSWTGRTSTRCAPAGRASATARRSASEPSFRRPGRDGPGGPPRRPGASRSPSRS